MRPFGEMVKDAEAMKKFGQTMVLWDFHARQPKQVLHVPGAPLEIRWAWGPHNNYAFTTTALTSKIWLVYEDEGGAWKAKEVADIGDPAKMPLPVDISLSADDKTLFVDTFMDGTTRVFDVSDPHKPKQILREEDRRASSTWCRRAGTANASTTRRRCSRTGTRPAPTTSSSSRPTPGTARSSRRRFDDRLHGREARAAAHDGVRGGGALHAIAMGGAGLAAGLVAIALALVPAAAAHEGHAPPPGAGVRSRYAFPLPAPGSYSLPPIKAAGDGRVLDEDGREQALRQLLLGRISVVAFIYTRCGDLCPAASLDMSQLQDLAAKDRRVSRRMRLVTISFDPEHDTPQTMRDYAAQFRSAAAAAPEWLFLTAPDRAALAPVLAAYNQAVDAKADPASAGGPLNHVFRAFLIDRAGQVRNIYSLDFFDPKLVLNDVRTLLLEDGAGARSRRRSSHTNPPGFRHKREVMVGVAEQHVDHGQALEVVADLVLHRHADAAVQLDRLLADEAAGAADLHLGGRDRLARARRRSRSCAIIVANIAMLRACSSATTCRRRGAAAPGS